MIRGILDSPQTIGVTLNIGNSEPEVTIGELAQTIVDVVGRPLNIVPGPETPGSPSRRCPDVSLLKSLTGVVGVVSLEEGVRRTYDWYGTNTFTGTEISAT
jgi:nucleoside-diphosphate-sugar epimerase